MRLATIRTTGGTRAARVEGDRLFPLEAADVRAALESPGGLAAAAKRGSGESLGWNEVSFAPLIPRPDKIFGIGWNYPSHAAEGGRGKLEYPAIFTKFPASLIGAFDPIAMPHISDQVDLEVELCVVVGKRVRYASVDEARAAIGGYTVSNDMSVRDWQRRTQFPMQGKAWERMTPIGPVLVTPDECGDADDLRVQSFADDFMMQDARTSEMSFSPAFLVSYMSTFITLECGDLILTGTPAGVGVRRDPPMFLKAGQVVRTRIEGLGECVNPCLPEKDWKPAAPGAASLEHQLA